MPIFPKSFFSRLSDRGGDHPSSKTQVGILAFEVARAMSRLVTLHRSLTPASVDLLWRTTIQSAGVSHLNSADHLYLVRLACAEMLDDLDRAAATISRLASRSLSPWPRGFEQVYSDLKSGSANFDRKVVFPDRTLDRKLKRMESFVSSTSNLYAEMETLAEMEASERKLDRWKNYSGPMTAGATHPPLQQNPRGADAFLKKFALQKKVVMEQQDESLWSQSKEKTSELMARAAITVFVRICEVFTKFVPELPVVDTRYGKFRANPNPQNVRIHPKNLSGPLDRSYLAGPPITMMKFSGPIMRNVAAMTSVKTDLAKWIPRFLEPPADTVGAAGLALRYADLIQLAEKMFHYPEYSGEEEREDLYQMLPGSLRAAIRTKLRGASRVAGDGDRNRWREEAGRVLGWLAPMANDTSKWFSDRSCEKRKIDSAPKVLMLQTLQFSDRRKAEAAIVDVLVGLCSIYQRGHHGW